MCDEWKLAEILLSGEIELCIAWSPGEEMAVVAVLNFGGICLPEPFSVLCVLKAGNEQTINTVAIAKYQCCLWKSPQMKATDDDLRGQVTRNI